MAKVIKGAVRANKKDPTARYANYKSQGRVVRRAAHPENYLHSWSQEVKKNRNALATAMENYSKMDIVTKQAYTEAIFLNPKGLEAPIIRYTINKVRQYLRNRGYNVAYPIPWYVPTPWTIPFGQALPNPWIAPEPWPYPDYNPWANKETLGGHHQAVRDEIARQHIPDPTRYPPPSEIPLPYPEPGKDRTPPKNPVYITLEIDPEGALGKSWQLYTWVHSEYSNIQRWIYGHKREVIIIVAFGTLITLGYSLVVGGLEFEAGTELLVTPAAERFYPISALMIPGVSIHHIIDSYYKKIMWETIKDLNIYALNHTRGWECYIEKEEDENTITFNIYTGPTKSHKGKLAADVSIWFDFEKGEADIIPHCYSPKDSITVYNGHRMLKHCGPIKPRLEPPYLYNYTKGIYGESKMEIGHGYILYSFEDRPVFGDGDFNDAYFRIDIDNNWNITGWEAIEGSHCDELGVFWLGIEWGHFPDRC